MPQRHESPSTRVSSPIWTYALLLSAASFWGTAFVFSKISEDSVPPVVAAFIRFGLAAIIGSVILIIQKLRNREYRATPEKGWVSTMGLGLVGVTGYNLLFFWGLSFSQASDGSMIIPTLSPAITILFAVLFFKERLRKREIQGLLLTVFGAIIFFFAILTLWTPSIPNRLLGDGLFFGAAVLWAASTLISKRTTRKVDPFVAAVYAMIFGSLVLGLIALPELLRTQWAVLSWQFWTNEGYLAVMPSVLANWFYYWGVNRIGPARASVFMYFVPVMSLLLATTILKETLSVAQILGTIFMISGVWMINRPRQQTRRAPKNLTQA